jgi:ABC-type phosphate/phosphonate transport system substrate-binding protein
VVEAGFYQRAIRLVHAGTVDAAAIDSQVLAIELRDHPDLANLRVIGAFGPSTIQPVVAARRLPEAVKDQVQELLVTLADDPAARPVLDHGSIERFALVDDAAYDDIRGMQAASRPPAGPASLRRLSTLDVPRCSRAVDQWVLSAAEDHQMRT